MTRGGIAALGLLLLASACNLPPTACGDDALTLEVVSGATQVSTTADGLAVDFGTVAIGARGEGFFEISEVCEGAAVSAIQVSGSSDFSLVLGADAGQGEYGYGYPYGAQSADAVLFRPSMVGLATATVTLTTTSRRTPTLVMTLVGTGVTPGPACGTDGDCDGGGFCDGKYCQPNACLSFDNRPAWDAGIACAPESRACPGSNGLVLIDTSSDPAHCGSCGQTCPGGEGCAGGRCGVCPGYRIGSEQDFPLGSQSLDSSQLVYALALGDFDGDGHPDALVAADLGVPGNAWLIINDGKGGFASAPRSLDVCGYSFAVGDFNGDCALDVLAGNSVMFNDGRGNFPVRSDFRSAYGFSNVAASVVADLNQDGYPDILGSTGLLLGDGRGGFDSSAFQLPALSSLNVLAVADFGGNGRPDVMGYEASPTGTFFYYFNDGGGDLVFESDYFPANPSAVPTLEPQSLVAGPLTGGTASLVYGQQGALTALPEPAVGAAGSALLPLDGGYQAFAIASADMDLDGHADVVAVGPQLDAGFLDVWVGFATDGGQLSVGTFQSVSTRHVAGFVAVSDVNGDGIPDIVAASPPATADPVDGPPTLMVFLGSCP